MKNEFAGINHQMQRVLVGGSRIRIEISLRVLVRKQVSFPVKAHASIPIHMEVRSLTKTQLQ